MFAKKLKALKEDIIQWNRQKFGNVGRRKKDLLRALELLDAKEGALASLSRRELRRLKCECK